MKSIGIFIGDFFNTWDEHDMENGMGGSETWAICLGKEFAKKGYDVTIFAKPEKNHDIIENCHLVDFNEYFDNLRELEFDFFIYSRQTQVISPYLKCKNVYVMAHDTCLITDENAPHAIGIGKIKAYCYLSEFHKDNLSVQNRI
jgi:hypothetical protein